MNLGTRESYSPSLFGHTYKFEMVKMPSGKVRIYILNPPNYKGRATGGHLTHVMNDGRDCIAIIPDKEPTNMREARSWYKVWAEGTDYYIKNGTWNV